MISNLSITRAQVFDEAGFFQLVADLTAPNSYAGKSGFRGDTINRSPSEGEKKLDTAALLEKKKDILQIAAKHGARNIRIFGSVARGEARSDSDVDFLVDMEPGRTLFDMGGLLMDLRDLLGLQVDVVTEQGLKPRIRDRVLREAELL